MKRDNNSLIYEAIGAAFTPEQIHLLAATVATPEQIAACAARITKTDAEGNPLDATPDAERLILADSLHTYNAWREQGLQVRAGQKALLSCMLWRWTDKPSKARRAEAAAAGQELEGGEHYYMKRCYLFSAAQVGKPEPVHVKTPEEIAAYNAELRAARQAARQAAQRAAQDAAPAAPAAPTILDAAPTPEPRKPAVVAVVEHHSLHDDAPTIEPVQLDFASLAAQVLA